MKGKNYILDFTSLDTKNKKNTKIDKKKQKKTDAKIDTNTKTDTKTDIKTDKKTDTKIDTKTDTRQTQRQTQKQTHSTKSQNFPPSSSRLKPRNPDFPRPASCLPPLGRLLYRARRLLMIMRGRESSEPLYLETISAPCQFNTSPCP